MKTIIFSALSIMFMAFVSNDKLVGRWESMSAAGNITGVVFKDDGTFEGYVNKKPFVTGNYTLQDSTFTMEDNGCMGVSGMYKLYFFSNNDSFRLELLNDACDGRANGVHNRVFGRVK